MPIGSSCPPPTLSLTTALEPILNGSRRGLLITGAARSGTGYVATLLGGMLGDHHTHERLTTPKPDGTLYMEHPLDNPPSRTIEVSWLAAPLVWNQSIDRGDWWVGMLVRHPLASINSIIRRGFLHPRSTSGYGIYARGHVSISRPGHPVTNVVQYWCYWNQSLLDGPGRPDFLWRVEDLSAQHRFSIPDRNQTPDDKGDRETPLLTGLGDLSPSLCEAVSGLGRRLGYDI